MENKNEVCETVFDVLWGVPGTDIQVHTECKTIDDLVIYIKAYGDHRIKIFSVNGMEVIPSSKVEVVK